MMTFQNLGTIATRPGEWVALPKVGSSPELLLKIAPQFDPALLAGFFWVKAYDSRLVLPWRRYYPDADQRSTLLDMRTPAALRSFPAWHHWIALRYVPYSGSQVHFPTLTVDEVI